DVQARLVRLWPHAQQRVLDDPLQVSRRQLHLDAVRLQLRKVQQVVEQAEQVLRGACRVLDESPSALGELTCESLEHQLAVALDREIGRASCRGREAISGDAVWCRTRVV